MAKNKRSSAIGLAMLDLISNSLAATIILFVIVSSLRLPNIPPERIDGTMIIRYEMIPPGPSGLASSDFGLSHSALKGRWYYHFDNEIADMNANLDLFGYRDNAKGEVNYENWSTPAILDYTASDNPNVHYVVVKDPPEGEWRTCLISRNHEELILDHQAAQSVIKAWFVRENTETMIITDTIVPASRLKAPTNSHAVIFHTPQWD